MYSESDLEAAVAEGALTSQQAAAFRDFVAAGRHTPVVDEEHFRLLTGFNDIFVGVAAAILLAAVAMIGYYAGPHVGGDGPGPVSGLLVAVTAWGLAEFFTLKRRMALPSIILLAAFVLGVFETTGTGIITVIGENNIDDSPRNAMIILSISAAVAAVSAWLHWRRFRVPITIAAGVAALVAVALGLIATGFASEDMTDAQVQTMVRVMEGSALVLGVGVFLFAMRWDASDPKRETRRSDVAFWLHLLAAPLIVHPVFSLLGLTQGDTSTLDGIAVILLYVVLGLVALAIDRRALLVSALAYVLYALNSLFETYGVVELNVALTALIIGSALLLLSAFWTSARRAVVKPLPDSLRGKLPVLDRAPAVPVAA